MRKSSRLRLALAIMILVCVGLFYQNCADIRVRGSNSSSDLPAESTPPPQTPAPPPPPPAPGETPNPGPGSENVDNTGTIEVIKRSAPSIQGLDRTDGSTGGWDLKEIFFTGSHFVAVSECAHHPNRQEGIYLFSETGQFLNSANYCALASPENIYGFGMHNDYPEVHFQVLSPTEFLISAMVRGGGLGIPYQSLLWLKINQGKFEVKALLSNQPSKGLMKFGNQILSFRIDADSAYLSSIPIDLFALGVNQLTFLGQANSNFDLTPLDSCTTGPYIINGNNNGGGISARHWGEFNSNGEAISTGSFPNFGRVIGCASYEDRVLVGGTEPNGSPRYELFERQQGGGVQSVMGLPRAEIVTPNDSINPMAYGYAATSMGDLMVVNRTFFLGTEVIHKLGADDQTVTRASVSPNGHIMIMNADRIHHYQVRPNAQ